MDNRQSDIRFAFIHSRCRENVFQINSIFFQTFFPSLMTPLKQLKKVDNPSGISLTKTNGSVQEQPFSRITLLQTTYLSTEPIITSIEPKIAIISATLAPFSMCGSICKLFESAALILNLQGVTSLLP